MKKHILTFILFVFLSSFAFCQKEENVELLEKELCSKNISNSLLNDSMIFFNQEGLIKYLNHKEAKREWIEIKKIFCETDFIIIKYIKKDKSNLNYYKIYNHEKIFIIGINHKGSISEIIEVQLSIPVDAPN